MLALLRREKGAELVAATGWPPHTTRAALTGMRKKGHSIRKGKRGHLTRLAHLTGLAPDLTSKILNGREPVQLTVRALLRMPDLPLPWGDQRQVLGFA